MKNRSRSGGLPDFLRLVCARVRPPIREQGTGKGTGSMEQGINSPPIPTTSTATRETSPVDGQPHDASRSTGASRPMAIPASPSNPRETPIDGPLAAVPFDAKGGTSPDDLHGLTVAARERGLARLRFAIAWCGPWERLEARLLAIDPGTLDLRRIVHNGTLRERLAAWCGSRDLAWQRRHVERGTTPARRWRRKAGRR